MKYLKYSILLIIFFGSAAIAAQRIDAWPFAIFDKNTLVVIDGRFLKSYEPGNLIVIYDPETGKNLGEYEFEIIMQE